MLARHVEPGDLPGALGQLLDALLPNELERRAERTSDNRGLRLRLKDDGSGWLLTRGELDLECGELLQTVIDTERAVDPDNPTDTAAYTQARDDGWQPGEDLPEQGCGGPRSLDQQRHDALRNALRRLGDPAAAEDAVQDAFIRAFRNLERFDGDYHLDAWLHRILTNTCHDIGRRRGRDTRLFDRACTEVDVDEPGADEAADEAGTDHHDHHAARDRPDDGAGRDADDGGRGRDRPAAPDRQLI